MANCGSWDTLWTGKHASRFYGLVELQQVWSRSMRRLAGTSAGTVQGAALCRQRPKLFRYPPGCFASICAQAHENEGDKFTAGLKCAQNQQNNGLSSSCRAKNRNPSDAACQSEPDAAWRCPRSIIPHMSIVICGELRRRRFAWRRQAASLARFAPLCAGVLHR